MGIISDEAESPWAAPIVLVKKKDGTIRLCIDYRLLNQVAARSSYPLPKINEIFAVLQDMRYFSSLDLAKGFRQIRVAEEDRCKTAFTTPYGQYQFNRLPFGLNSSPGAFQSVMTRALGDLLWTNCVVYVDDILIFTETIEQHRQVLHKVLQRLAKADLKIKLDKCDIARTQLQYLGHVINSQGISTDPKKVEAVRNWAPPSSVKEIEQFLGTVNYYSKFIKDFSNRSAPLNRLKRKGTTWDFNEECTQAFEDLKAALCTAPVLRHPDMSREFILTTDASGWGLGATLSQIFEDGEEHPVSFASRTLKEQET